MTVDCVVFLNLLVIFHHVSVDLKSQFSSDLMLLYTLSLSPVSYNINTASYSSDIFFILNA